MSERRYDRLKRVLDVVVAACGLIVTAPIQVVVAILVRRRLGSPVLFRQLRLGRHAEPFTLVKFRTMQPVDPAAGLLTDADRVTRLGALLRSTSLDELPTLWNVLRGDMSVVGPRPLLTHYLARYSEEQARRHEVRPGVTGLAQVSGRNLLPWEERLAVDVEYVDRRSFALDVKILVRTVWLVARRKGIAAHGDVTMPEFTGSGHE